MSSRGATPHDLVGAGLFPLTDEGIVLREYRDAARARFVLERTKRMTGWRGGECPVTNHTRRPLPPQTRFILVQRAIAVDRMLLGLSLAVGLRRMFSDHKTRPAKYLRLASCPADTWTPANAMTIRRVQKGGWG